MEYSKKLIAVVDMINGFVKEGAMADPGINRVTPNISSVIANNPDADVIFICDAHNPDALEFESFPPHCIKGSHESQVIDELLEFTNENNIYEKNSTSAMFAPGIIEKITANPELEEIIICGCCTDICIMNFAVPLVNYLNQINRKIVVKAPQNLTETYDAPNHERDKYNEMGNTLMAQAGVNVKPLQLENYRKF